MRAVIIGCLQIAVSVCSAQAGQGVFVPCDNDGDPWIERYCIRVESDIRTTITMTSSDSKLSFVLFDNMLDRDCLIVFRSQPDFWQHEDSTDASKIILPFPATPTGRYNIVVKTTDTTFNDTLVIMR